MFCRYTASSSTVRNVLSISFPWKRFHTISKRNIPATNTFASIVRNSTRVGVNSFVTCTSTMSSLVSNARPCSRTKLVLKRTNCSMTWTPLLNTLVHCVTAPSLTNAVLENTCENITSRITI
uniref:Uncharacterized protein n=1 Tax=Cacopsylla melanoneura TaxID=428564 RepID=A0A8D8WZ98_9HEMI